MSVNFRKCIGHVEKSAMRGTYLPNEMLTGLWIRNKIRTEENICKSVRLLL